MSRTALTCLAALTVCAMAAAIVVESADAANIPGGGNYNKWAKTGTEKDKDKDKKKEDAHTKDIERLKAATEAVEKEETAAKEALTKAEDEAAKTSGDDAAQRERLVALARRKGVAAFEGCGSKYGRVLVAAHPIGQRAGLSDNSKAALQMLIAKVNMLRRSNVERIADLHEKMGKDRSSLAILEAYYRSLPENQRFAALSIKERIDALKERTNPKRRAGGAR